MTAIVVEAIASINAVAHGAGAFELVIWRQAGQLAVSLKRGGGHRGGS